MLLYYIARQRPIAQLEVVLKLRVAMKAHVGRQITVPLENQPGQLARLCQLLAERSVSVEALSVIEGVEHGVVRLLTSDHQECKQTLSKSGFFVIEGDVLVLDLTDKVGKLAQASAALAHAKVNIDYLYGSVGQAGMPARIILKASDLGRAREILEKLQD
jgi:hypothetical protein